MIKDYTDHELTKRMRYYNSVKLLKQLAYGGSLVFIGIAVYTLLTGF